MVELLLPPAVITAAAVTATSLGTGLAWPPQGPMVFQTVPGQYLHVQGHEAHCLPCYVLSPDTLPHACSIEPLDLTYKTLTYFEDKIIKNFKIETEEKH